MQIKNVAVLRMAIILRIPITPDAQKLLEDEEGDEAGEQQPGKLTSVVGAWRSAEISRPQGEPLD